ncbi:hypothetical protein HK405_002505, partial [Cladochytrium tenue]
PARNPFDDAAAVANAAGKNVAASSGHGSGLRNSTLSTDSTLVGSTFTRSYSSSSSPSNDATEDSASAAAATPAVAASTANDDDQGPDPSDHGSISYRAVLRLFTFSLDVFYREVRARGTFKVPRHGPVIFVIAPHASQFVDPFVVLMHAGRKIGFLAAKKSMDLFWIGMFARSIDSIPVVRPQDIAKTGAGKIFFKKDSTTTVLGAGSRFLSELHPRAVIKVAGVSLE